VIAAGLKELSPNYVFHLAAAWQPWQGAAVASCAAGERERYAPKSGAHRWN
jgi:hypothetical protein